VPAAPPAGLDRPGQVDSVARGLHQERGTGVAHVREVLCGRQATGVPVAVHLHGYRAVADRGMGGDGGHHQVRGAGIAGPGEVRLVPVPDRGAPDRAASVRIMRADQALSSRREFFRLPVARAAAGAVTEVLRPYGAQHADRGYFGEPARG
jgi:hypothetical protein